VTIEVITVAGNVLDVMAGDIHALGTSSYQCSVDVTGELVGKVQVVAWHWGWVCAAKQVNENLQHSDQFHRCRVPDPLKHAVGQVRVKRTRLGRFPRPAVRYATHPAAKFARCEPATDDSSRIEDVVDHLSTSSSRKVIGVVVTCISLFVLGGC
jgi:hypothetical protein